MENNFPKPGGGVRVIAGYNVNIDSVYQIKGDELSLLLEKGGVEGWREGRDEIWSLGDLARGLYRCLKRGKGEEWLVFNPGVVDFIEENFPGRLRLGGNAGIMANVMAGLGAGCVVVNASRLTRRQASLFTSRRGIAVPALVDGGLRLCRPLDAARGEAGGEAVHFVFDFLAGTRVSVEGEVFRVPRNDRFIASFDPPNVSLEIDPLFERFTRENAGFFDGAVVSGFHLLGADGFRERVWRSIEQVKGWKQVNPGLWVHLELGHFVRPEIANLVLGGFSGVVDSVGMNEEELSGYLGCQDILEGDVLEGAVSLFERLDVSRVCVHTRDFVVSALQGLPPGLELRALEGGVKVAASLAATGKTGDWDFVERSISRLRVSRVGREMLKGWKVEGMGGFRVVDGVTVCLVPTFVCEEPVTTVGLGDTFTAGVLLRELELRRFARQPKG